MRKKQFPTAAVLVSLCLTTIGCGGFDKVDVQDVYKDTQSVKGIGTYVGKAGGVDRHISVGHEYGYMGPISNAQYLNETPFSWTFEATKDEYLIQYSYFEEAADKKLANRREKNGVFTFSLGEDGTRTLTDAEGVVYTLDITVNEPLYRIVKGHLAEKRYKDVITGMTVVNFKGEQMYRGNTVLPEDMEYEVADTLMSVCIKFQDGTYDALYVDPYQQYNLVSCFGNRVLRQENISLSIDKADIIRENLYGTYSEYENGQFVKKLTLSAANYGTDGMWMVEDHSLSIRATDDSGIDCSPEWNNEHDEVRFNFGTRQYLYCSDSPLQKMYNEKNELLNG